MVIQRSIPHKVATLEGLVNTLDGWTDSAFRIVPARGKVTNGADVKAFRDMIVTVRDRVKPPVARRSRRESKSWPNI